MQILLQTFTAHRRKFLSQTIVPRVRAAVPGLFTAGVLVIALLYSASARGQLNTGGQSSTTGTASTSIQLGGQAAPSAQANSNFQGSLTTNAVTPGTLSLTLDEAVQRGLQTNLGLLLSSVQSANARGQRLQDLQALLPTVDGSIKEALVQSDLAAQGLRIPGFQPSSALLATPTAASI